MFFFPRYSLEIGLNGRPNSYLETVKLLTRKRILINHKNNSGFSALGILVLFDTICQTLPVDETVNPMTKEQLKELNDTVKFLKENGARLDIEELKLIQRSLQSIL